MQGKIFLNFIVYFTWTEYVTKELVNVNSKHFYYLNYKLII